MYQTQLINLLRELCLVSKQKFNFNQLLTDPDYRNHFIELTKLQNDAKISMLTQQIQIYVDLIHQESNVDYLTEINTQQSVRKQHHYKTALALSCFFFITTSLITVEEVKQIRKQHKTNQFETLKMPTLKLTDNK